MAIKTDLALLRLIMDKDEYTKYYRFIRPLNAIQKTVDSIIGSITSYFKKYEGVEGISVDELEVFHNQEHTYSRKDAYTVEVFKELNAFELNNKDLAKDVILAFVTGQANSQIMQLAAEGLDSGDTKEQFANMLQFIEETRDTLDSLDNGSGLDPNYVNVLTMSDLRSFYAVENGLMWPMKQLTDSLGLLVPGTFGIFFAIPNAGKTSFGMNCAVNMAYQLKDTKENIIYGNNEQAGPVIYQRSKCCLLGKPWYEIADLDDVEINQLWADKGGSRLKIYDNVYSMGYVEELIRRHSPRVFVMDMCLKVKMAGLGEGHFGLQQLCFKFRELAKKYNVAIIGMAQADMDARKKQWLSDHNIHGSNTDVAGECDWMIGMTHLEEVEGENPDARYLSIAKDKIGCRDKHITGYIDRYTGRFRDTL